MIRTEAEPDPDDLDAGYSQLAEEFNSDTANGERRAARRSVKSNEPASSTSDQQASAPVVNLNARNITPNVGQVSDTDSASCASSREVRKRETAHITGPQDGPEVREMPTHYPYEMHKPGWSVGCWGPEAARFAADTLTGQRIALVADPGQDSHDRYGRTYLH